MDAIPCHYGRPFLDRHGDLYPCCFKNNDRSYIIGNICDENLLEKVKNYSIDCQCGFHKFRCANAADTHEALHIQTSLRCHGKCAVCYVAAPLKQERTELDYEKAYVFLKQLAPRDLFLEGGEVPIQNKALDFAQKAKETIPFRTLHLLTNGCYPVAMAERLADIFTHIAVSYMGFSKNLYYHETMLDVNVTNNFVRAVHNRLGEIAFRYISTPLSVIEAGYFFNFTLTLPKTFLIYADCDLSIYTKSSPEVPYWMKIIERARMKFKEALVLGNRKMIENQSIIKFEPRTAALFGIDSPFIDKFKLQNISFF